MRADLLEATQKSLESLSQQEIVEANVQKLVDKRTEELQVWEGGEEGGREGGEKEEGGREGGLERKGVKVQGREGKGGREKWREEGCEEGREGRKPIMFMYMCVLLINQRSMSRGSVPV